jgi:hypothetical protein
MPRKSNFNQYENFTDANGNCNKNVVLMTHFDSGRTDQTYFVSQLFYRFPDGSLKPISEENYGTDQISSILGLFCYHFGYQQTIDEYDIELFRQEKKKTIDVIAEV